MRPVPEHKLGKELRELARREPVLRQRTRNRLHAIAVDVERAIENAASGGLFAEVQSLRVRVENQARTIGQLQRKVEQQRRELWPGEPMVTCEMPPDWSRAVTGQRISWTQAIEQPKGDSDANP